MINVNLYHPTRAPFSFQFELEDEEYFTQLALRSPTWVTSAGSVGAVLTVRANGECLEKLKVLFPNLPYTTLKTTSWTGDLASFIMVNLQAYAIELESKLL